jgi:hypothetical protein
MYASEYAAQAMPILTDPYPKPADANTKLLQYDVASVKLNKSGDRMMRIMNRPDALMLEDPMTELTIAMEINYIQLN